MWELWAEGLLEEACAPFRGQRARRRHSGARLGLGLGHGGAAGSQRVPVAWIAPAAANSTLTPELREAKVFVMGNKRCDKIYRKESSIPHISPLVLGDMICATNFGENLCNVSLGKDSQVGGRSRGGACWPRTAPIPLSLRL